MAAEEPQEEIELEVELGLEARVVAKLIGEAKTQLNAIERQKRDARRAYMREYYARNRRQYLEDQRQYRAKRKAADPEAYRAKARERNKRWHDRYRDQINEKLRAKYASNPGRTREKRRKSYAENGEVLRARRRAYYAANKDRINAQNRAARAQDRARYNAGLPSRRLQRVTGDLRRAHDAEANGFFARGRTPEQIAALRAEERTPMDLYRAWKIDSSRARAAHRLQTQLEELAYLNSRLEARGVRVCEPEPEAAPQPNEAERMDAIARSINERLRRYPRRREPLPDSAAPHPHLQAQLPRGLDR